MSEGHKRTSSYHLRQDLDELAERVERLEEAGVDSACSPLLSNKEICEIQGELLIQFGVGALMVNPCQFHEQRDQLRAWLKKRQENSREHPSA